VFVLESLYKIRKSPERLGSVKNSEKHLKETFLPATTGTMKSLMGSFYGTTSVAFYMSVLGLPHSMLITTLMALPYQMSPQTVI